MCIHIASEEKGRRPRGCTGAECVHSLHRGAVVFVCCLCVVHMFFVCVHLHPLFISHARLRVLSLSLSLTLPLSNTHTSYHLHSLPARAICLSQYFLFFSVIFFFSPSTRALSASQYGVCLCLCVWSLSVFVCMESVYIHKHHKIPRIPTSARPIKHTHTLFLCV